MPSRVVMPCVQGDQVSVHRAHEDAIAQRRHAPVHRAAAGGNPLGDAPAILPKRPPGAGVERGDVARRLGDVHDAVNHERRGLELVAAVDLIDPQRPQTGGILGRDLVERGVTMPEVVARVGEPVARLLGCRDDPLERHLRGERAGQRGDRRDALHRSPLSDARYATRSSSSPAVSRSR